LSRIGATSAARAEARELVEKPVAAAGTGGGSEGENMPESSPL
jgi:hypothetical protein